MRLLKVANRKNFVNLEIITILLIAFLLSACSNVGNTKSADNTLSYNKISEEDKEEDLSDYVNAPFKAECIKRVKIRNGHSVDNDVVGYIDEGDKFEVYETYVDEEYVWNKISDDCWVANNGEWLKRIHYDEHIEEYISDIVKFPIPKETHERIHCEDSNYYYDVEETRVFSGIDDYKCSSVTYYQKTSYVYSDDSFEDSYYEESNENTIAGPVNPFINIQSGQDCSYEYDDEGKIIRIKVEYSDDVNNHSYWCFEYDDNDLLISVMEYSHDYSILLLQCNLEYDNLNRFTKISKDSWNDNSTSRRERSYRYNTYQYNGNLIFSKDKSDESLDNDICKIIKLKDSKVNTIYYFIDREYSFYTFSIKDYVY